MDNFYEIIKKLKISDEKRKPEEKRAFKIKPRILFLSFFSLVVLSGLALVIFSYYMKNVKITSQESLKPPISSLQVNETVSITNPLPQEGIAEFIPKKKLTQTSPVFKNALAKNISKPQATQTYVISEPKEEKEPPIEGFLLTKEDLLNNLLLVAEEERKAGNCKKAIFYYKSYLKERENSSVMNNLGACLIELGDFDFAINIFNKALSLKNDPEIKYNLIIAYFRKGDKEKACFELKNLDTNSFLDERMKRLKELCK
uniref:Tetratricopeptide repeat protein n=1 Tax=Thermodesulfobacterium geofontis TaxID=1295609 RepID=A0A7C4NXA5_9BACT